jgi:curved DNA-binding protein CbpA
MTSPERRDPYLVLDVPRQASAAEIARAYRRAARASHPDSGDAGSAERFRMVRDAYDELRDPGRRAMYDRSHPIARSPTAGTPGGSVRYAAPGSQHVVLGRSAPDDLAQLALSLLRIWG